MVMVLMNRERVRNDEGYPTQGSRPLYEMFHLLHMILIRGDTDIASKALLATFWRKGRAERGTKLAISRTRIWRAKRRMMGPHSRRDLSAGTHPRANHGRGVD